MTGDLTRADRPRQSTRRRRQPLTRPGPAAGTRRPFPHPPGGCLLSLRPHSLSQPSGQELLEPRDRKTGGRGAGGCREHPRAHSSARTCPRRVPRRAWASASQASSTASLWSALPAPKPGRLSCGSTTARRCPPPRVCEGGAGSGGAALAGRARQGGEAVGCVAASGQVLRDLATAREHWHRGRVGRAFHTCFWGGGNGSSQPDAMFSVKESRGNAGTRTRMGTFFL